MSGVFFRKTQKRKGQIPVRERDQTEFTCGHIQHPVCGSPRQDRARYLLRKIKIRLESNRPRRRPGRTGSEKQVQPIERACTQGKQRLCEDCGR